MNGYGPSFRMEDDIERLGPESEPVVISTSVNVRP